MENVQDLINIEKAIIINQFFNAMEKSEGELESSIQDIKIKNDEIKDKYEELKATNERESQSKKNLYSNEPEHYPRLPNQYHLPTRSWGYDQEPDEHTRSPDDNGFSWGKDHHYHMRIIILLGVEEI